MYITSGVWLLIAFVIRFAITSVDSRLVPSGARRLISNSDWSSFGRKFLLATMNSGTLENRTSTATTATTARWLIAHSSIRV